ncbi:MAG: rod shape-determining protein MreD [Chlorobiaceae bacterium]|nr:rod shape-determining protein MreD [Chlorobiaceae bacterium]
MKKFSIYTAALFILPFVQHFAISKLLLMHTSPDLLAIFIAFISMSVGQRTGTSFGFAAGLISGFLSGNPGLGSLIGSSQGLLAGLFHVPEEKHATSVKKKRMFYGASLTSVITGKTLLSLFSDPLSLPIYVRLPEAIILGSLMSMLLSVIIWHVGLKKMVKD